jgi:hypothetical protein
VVQVSHLALFAEPIPEPGDGERLSKLRDQERQVSAPRGFDNGTQRRMYRNVEFYARGPLSFSADPIQHSVADVLWPHGNDILPSLPL